MKSILYISLLAAGFFFACSNKGEKAGAGEKQDQGPEGIVFLTLRQREALDLQLGTFRMRNMTTVIKTNGQLEVPPSSKAEVTAIIGGNVKEIKVFHGDRVSRGQVLGVLEHPDYIRLQEDFSEIANRLEFLELEYNRQKELFENNVGSGKDFQQVKSDYNTAKARYSGLKARLELLNLSSAKVKDGEISNTITINSPIGGYVNAINIKVGTYADAKDILFEITDNSEIHSDFLVYEKDVHLLKEGQKIDFTVANRPDEELSATIFAIGKEFETRTRAVHIHARLDKNAGNLIPGMYVSGHIHTDDIYNRALPDDAVVTEGTKSYIFILDKSVGVPGTPVEQGKPASGSAGDQGAQAHALAFRKVEVITGRKDEGHTEIRLLDSLPADTRVVLNAAYYLLADMNKEESENSH